MDKKTINKTESPKVHLYTHTHTHTICQSVSIVQKIKQGKVLRSDEERDALWQVANYEVKIKHAKEIKEGKMWI